MTRNLLASLGIIGFLAFLVGWGFVVHWLIDFCEMACAVGKYGW